LSRLRKEPTGLNDFMRSSFHSENLPETIGKRRATGLKPEATEEAAGADGVLAGMGTDVDATGAPPILLAGSMMSSE
jgi:hypothetical protein